MSAPHPSPPLARWPYVYSYDVSSSPGRSATAPRSIPGMRPSYDAEHPHSTTPIYDELYSEYRRLFRALPGDRTGEEDMAFTGFAVRDGYPLFGEPRPYPPQHQAFHTVAGQVPGLPQFMSSQAHGTGVASGHHNGHTGHTGSHQHSHHGGHHSHHHATHPGSHPEPAVPAATAPAPVPVPANDGTGHTAPGPASIPPPAQPTSTAAQFTNGQGWVAAGYLGPVPHAVSVPAPAPPAPPAPSPVMGTATGLAAAPSTGGRHRQMLSLPPGRNGDLH